jgi:hypothetical protein
MHPRARPAERARQREQDIAARMIANDEGETVEWVNMCIRKSWRVFQRGLERWFTDLLQPVFDGLLEVRRPCARPPAAGAQPRGRNGFSGGFQMLDRGSARAREWRCTGRARAAVAGWPRGR